MNDSEKTMRMISNNRSNTLSHFAGSLNVFGSGAFSDLLLSNWVKDNFIDYATFVVDNTEKSGVLVSDFLLFCLYCFTHFISDA